MKRVVFLLLFLAGSLFSYSQGRHISLKECDNDTLKYIRVNFEENKARYIGKPFGVLLDELGLEIRYYFPGSFWPGHPDPKLREKLNSISIYYLYSREVFARDKSREKYYMLDILFKPPYLTDVKVAYELPSRWHQKCYDFYKYFVVEDITIYKYPDLLDEAEARGREEMKRKAAQLEKEKQSKEGDKK